MHKNLAAWVDIDFMLIEEKDNQQGSNCYNLMKNNGGIISPNS